MKLTNEQREIAQKYGHLFVNTGGNDPIELMERDDINFHNNYVAASLQIACQSQTALLQKLIASGMVMPNAELCGGPSGPSERAPG